MHQYQLKKTKEISKIICNQCGREISVINGRPEEEVLCVEYTWGYFSGKDGESCSFDLCEECYDRITASFAVPPKISEDMEG